MQSAPSVEPRRREDRREAVLACRYARRIRPRIRRLTAMLFRHLYDDDLAQGSFLVGCQAAGEAIVIDPRRDVGVYLDEAANANLRIVAVTETHVHADYLSGSRELAVATGAVLHLSTPGDAYAFAATPLRDGSVIDVGNVRVRAVHTPGHTPEHLAFLITDRATTDDPAIMVTGDFVFVGDVGRPDLIDETGRGADTRFAAAAALFRSLADRFLTLPDHLQVWPGHGAGSACGKALGAVANTTVGYERRVAWWVPYVERDDAPGFVDELLAGQPDAPAYFGRMKRQNAAGPAILGALPPLRPYGATELADGAHLLVDARPHALPPAAGIEGAISVPAGSRFATYASYVIDPERDVRPIVLLGTDSSVAEDLRARLLRVGIDRVVGYLHDVSAMPTRTLPSVAPGELDQLEDRFVLDVRTRSEFADGHVPGAHRLHAGSVMWNLDRIPRDRPVVTYCQSGARSAVAASALRAAGFDDVRELHGSFDAWRRQQPAHIDVTTDDA